MNNRFIKFLKIACLCVLILGLIPPVVTVAQSETLPLTATAAVLVEQTTGRVLYSKNPHGRMYPASTTKILTAMVVMEHLDLNRVVTIGQEIRGMPAGFATNLHTEGETISVEMLLKALLIRSSNEAGRILALETIRVVDGDPGVSYNTAKNRFSQLMNQHAARLGANNSNFNNPYGLHSEQHFTTAYDLALIARAFMNNEQLMAMASIREFNGDSLGGISYHAPNTHQYHLVNTNLMLPGAPFGHPYIVGGRTGFTTPAGHCFVGLAYHNGLNLIAVVLNSTDVARWQDTRLLIDYGFINYQFRTVATEGEVAYTAAVHNPRLGDASTLYLTVQNGHTALLSQWEYDSLVQDVTINPLFVAEDGEGLTAPIEAGAIVGTLQYTALNQVIFTTPIIAQRYVYPRTFDSNMDYYIAMFLDNVFTVRGLPYWFGFIGSVFGIIGVSAAVSANRKAKRQDNWGNPSARRRR